MKKNGFTLIEIIISLSLIVIVGVGSIIGVSSINKWVKISRLEQITDKAIEAA
jgi:prepilin-type N-terminal cleavage/methylation domain-containing protein